MGNRQPAEQTRRSQLLGQLSGPLRRFLATESGSALLMVSATVVALVWANSPWSGAYQAIWATKSSVLLGDAGLEMDLGHWINDGLMAVFFFVIGLEVRRDLAVGELTDRRRVVLPVLAGIGGMVVPVLLYPLIAQDGEATRGWGHRDRHRHCLSARRPGARGASHLNPTTGLPASHNCR